jgi:acyl dehydratase
MGGVLWFDDVHEGDEAPEVRHTLTRTDLVRYAGASGDFNPMHHDEVAAKDVGLPSVFGHGMFSMGLLGRAVSDWVGVGALRTFKVRFTKQTWPGEVLVSSVTITAKREVEGEHLVDLEVTLANADGQTKAEGTATAALPSRAAPPT